MIVRKYYSSNRLPELLRRVLLRTPPQNDTVPMNCAAATTEACIYLHSKLLFCKLCYKIEELYLALSTEPAKKTKCKSLRILVSPHPLLFLKKLVDNSIIRIFFSSIFCCFAEFLAASSRSLKVEPTSVPTGAEELGGEEEVIFMTV